MTQAKPLFSVAYAHAPRPHPHPHPQSQPISTPAVLTLATSDATPNEYARALFHRCRRQSAQTRNTADLWFMVLRMLNDGDEITLLLLWL